MRAPARAFVTLCFPEFCGLISGWCKAIRLAALGFTRARQHRRRFLWVIELKCA